MAKKGYCKNDRRSREIGIIRAFYASYQQVESRLGRIQNEQRQIILVEFVDFVMRVAAHRDFRVKVRV